MHHECGGHSEACFKKQIPEYGFSMQNNIIKTNSFLLTAKIIDNLFGKELLKISSTHFGQRLG